MTILFDASAPVKASRTFGKGLLRSTPSHRTDYTAADAAWLAQDNATRATYDRLVDELYAEREAQRLVEAGLC